MKSSTTLGLSLIAGAVLIETALIPGLVIGSAAVLAPKVLSRFAPKGQRRRSSNTAASKSASRSVVLAPEIKVPSRVAPSFAVKQAILKTITFRMIATSVDFTANMVVIGDLTTAAGLSAFGLVGAPLFYLGHEVFWNRAAPAGTRVDVGMLVWRRSWPGSVGRGLTMNRALAKTITYEIVVTTVDFTANFVATGDVAAAAVLTGFALVVSPFIYYGHEKAWDYFGGRRVEVGASSRRNPKALMAPA
jgi:uncharacterized membrane protein